MFVYTLSEISTLLKQNNTPITGTHLIPHRQLDVLLNNVTMFGKSGGHDGLPNFIYHKDECIKIIHDSRIINFPTDDDLISLGFHPNLMNYARIKFERYNQQTVIPVANKVNDVVAFIKGKGIESYTIDIKKALTELLAYNSTYSLGCVEFVLLGSSKPILEIKTYSGWVQTTRVALTRSFIEEVILLNKELTDQ